MNKRHRHNKGRRSNNAPRPLDTTPFMLTIDNLSHDGRGVGRQDGKAIFVTGALPGEIVEVERTQQHAKFDEAKVREWQQESSERVDAPCPHYQQCGGCELQHLSPESQLRFKEEQVLSQLRRIGRCVPEQVEAPLHASSSHYRRSARIGINQRSNGEVVLGFRRPQSNKLTNIDRCYVLDEALNDFLEAFRPLLEQNEKARNLTHIQLSWLGEQGIAILRVVKAVSDDWLHACHELCAQHQLTLYLDEGQGPAPYQGAASDLGYSLSQGINIAISPGDFFQVNADINQAMIDTALEWLAIDKDDHLLDLFCGAGNFSLPLAQQAAQVTGIEGVSAMVNAAKANAANNQLKNCAFFHADLTDDLRQQTWYKQPFSKILLDPPRTGAAKVVENIGQYGASHILYVSCNPAALARDTEALQAQGYSLAKFCIANMFPHTAHIESLALFVKSKNKKKVKSAQL